MTRWVLFLLGLALLAPSALAQSASVSLVAADGSWNGESAREAPFDGATARLWVPAEARLQEVVAVVAGAETATSWRAGSSQSLEVRVPANASRLVARFDLPAREPFLATVSAVEPLSRFELHVTPPEGKVVRADGVAFEEVAGVQVASLGPLEAGASRTLRVVDADRVGEVPVMAAVGALALVGLGAGVLWHRMRPINEGRPPERFLDHLGELQARIVPPVLVFALLNLTFFSVGLRLVTRGGFQLVQPVFGADASLAARAFDAFAERLTPPHVQLVVTRPFDAVLAQVEMALFLSFVAVLPLLLYETAAFLWPALVARERRLVATTLPVVGGLFVGGAVFGLVAMAPFMMRTLYGFAPAIGAEPLLVVQDLVAFAVLVVLVFGLAFELPVAMYALTRLRIVSAATWRKYWRHALVVILVVSGIVTPDPSVVTQLLVAAPLTVLYVVGLLASTVATPHEAQAA